MSRLNWVPGELCRQNSSLTSTFKKGDNMETPWAILLCKFNDSNAEPFARSAYERLFTTAGSGSNNMIDYFRDVSHGLLDLRGTQIFGWYTLGYSSSEYTRRTTIDRNAGRRQLVTSARQAAQNAGVNLDNFYGVVVCMNVVADLFGGLGYAVCDVNSMNQSMLGQEMGHGYGLDHSLADGSWEEYQDRWDIMSAMNSWSATHNEFTNIGPLLNAWNMRGRGWLDETRVWRGDLTGLDARLELRPLARHDLPGWLAAELPGGYLVEFRTPVDWDQAIPRAAILVHRFVRNYSILMKSVSDSWDIVQGDAFQMGDPVRLQDPYLRLDVETIDAARGCATVRIQYRPAEQNDLGIFYRGDDDWLVWRSYSANRWHGQEIFNSEHPNPTKMGGGPDIFGGTEAAPAAISNWDGNQLAVFFRGEDNHLHWKAHQGERWHQDALIEGGGILTSDPALARAGQDDLGVFYRSADNWLTWRSYSRGQWYGEEIFNATHANPTRLRSAPVAVADWAGHRFAVFFRGEDDRLHWKAHHGGRWHSEALLEGGGILTSNLALVRFGNSDLGLFYRTEGDWLAWRAYSGGQWHGEEIFDERHAYPTRMRSAPTVVSGWAAHRFAVFFRGEDDRLYWKVHSAGRWHSHACVEHGGRLRSQPAVVAFAAP